MAELSSLASDVRRHDRDRFYAALFGPPERREALFALYAFNCVIARVRETVSEPLLGEIRLQWWQDAIAAIYDGRRPPAEPTAIALADVIRTCRPDSALFNKLIEGRRRDLDARAPADIDELRDYAEATSSSLNALALAILANSDPAVGAAARDIGIAWALSGLMRALPIHLAQGRIWLPETLMNQAGIDPDHLRQGKPGPGIGQAVAAVVEAATAHLVAARKAVPRPPKAALPVMLMATLAEADLKRLAKAGNDPFAAYGSEGGVGRLVRLSIKGLSGRY